MTATYLDRITGVETSVAIKAPVVAATTAAITLSGEQTIDGVAVMSGDRVLVKDQVNAIDNGIWDVSTGSWSRSDDFNGIRDAVRGTQIYVVSGSANDNTIWLLTTDSAEIGVTPLSFTLAFEAGSSTALPIEFYDTTAAFMLAIIPSATTRVVIDNASGEMVGYRREPGASGPEDLQHPDGSDWAKATLTSSDLLAAVTDAVAGAEFVQAESGTFTPTITFASPGDLAVTYGSIQRGDYRLVNGQVTFWININTASLAFTTASGNLRVSGLPYACSSLCVGSGSWRLIPQWIAPAPAVDLVNAGITVASGQSYVEFGFQRFGGAFNPIQASHCVTGTPSIMQFMGSYFI